MQTSPYVMDRRTDEDGFAWIDFAYYLLNWFK